MGDTPMTLPTATIVRFWSKVAVGDPDACWLRIPESDRFHISKRNQTEFRRAAWVVSHGYMPDRTRHVEVTCANVRCVNPRHLICPTTEERFWMHVDKSGECWTWTGALAKGLTRRKSHHYGAFCYRQDGKRVWIMAHRYSYELANGPIEGHIPGHPEKEICVLHRCDNTRCVRPEHLFLGSDRDNIHDMIRKGRHPTSKTIPEERRAHG